MGGFMTKIAEPVALRLHNQVELLFEPLRLADISGVFRESIYDIYIKHRSLQCGP